MLYASFICFNDTATTEIYTLSLHDALPISRFPSQNYIGWLFCSIGLLAGVLLFCGEYAYYSLLARPGSLPGGEVMAWIDSWLWVPHVGLFAFLGLIPRRSVADAPLATLRVARRDSGRGGGHRGRLRARADRRNLCHPQSPRNRGRAEPLWSGRGAHILPHARGGSLRVGATPSGHRCGAPADQVVRLRRCGGGRRRHHLVRGLRHAGRVVAALGGGLRGHRDRPGWPAGRLGRSCRQVPPP